MLNILPTCFEEVTGKSQTRPQANNTTGRKRPGQAPARPRKQVGAGMWLCCLCCNSSERPGQALACNKLLLWRMLHVLKQRRDAQDGHLAGPASRCVLTSGQWTCATHCEGCPGLCRRMGACSCGQLLHTQGHSDCTSCKSAVFIGSFNTRACLLSNRCARTAAMTMRPALRGMPWTRMRGSPKQVGATRMGRGTPAPTAGASTSERSQGCSCSIAVSAAGLLCGR